MPKTINDKNKLTKFFLDEKGVPFLETFCQHCEADDLILKFKASKKVYKCPRCKKIIFKLKEKK